MEKELLEAILSTMESMQARIEAIEKTMEASGVSLDNASGLSLDGNEDSEFAEFSTRHGEKLAPYTELFAAIHGGKDLGRHAYDSAMERSEIEGYSEDGVVDSILSDLADIVGLIETVKGKITPGAEPALEAAEQAVEEAAVEAGAAQEAAVEKESDPGEEEDPSLTLDDDELQAIWDRSSGPGYVSR
jgi:hypothetical protein